MRNVPAWYSWQKFTLGNFVSVYVCVCVSWERVAEKERACLVFLDSKKEIPQLIYFHKLSEKQANSSLGKVLCLVFVLFCFFSFIKRGPG